MGWHMSIGNGYMRIWDMANMSICNNGNMGAWIYEYTSIWVYRYMIYGCLINILSD